MATTTSTRANLPECIYRRPDGYQVKVKLGGRELTKRYPFDTPIAKMEDTRDEFRIQLRHAAASVASGATLPRNARTFRDDVETYLAHLRGRVAAKDLHPTSLDGFERYLEAWCAHFGDRPRGEIKTREFSDQLAAFEREGVVREAPLGPETVNKVRLAALGLYEYMNVREDLADAPNPVTRVPRRTPPKPEGRGINYEILAAILGKLPAGSPTAARLALAAYTGLRPCEIASIHVADWNKRTGELYVRTAKGGPRATIALLPQATRALEELERLDAWGYYWPSPVGRALTAAKIAAGYPHVELRAYDMRHSYGTLVYLETGDIKATNEALRQKTLRMTERYVEAAVSPMLKRVHATLAKRFDPGTDTGKGKAAKGRKATRTGNTLVAVRGGRA
jgi:integrase